MKTYKIYKIVKGCYCVEDKLGQLYYLYNEKYFSGDFVWSLCLVKDNGYLELVNCFNTKKKV